MEKSLKDLRKEKELTQMDCAEILKMPLRTYQYYEEGKNKNNSRYEFIYNKIDRYGYIDEEHGLQTIEGIKKGVLEIINMDEYIGHIKDCYLFGSYAKGYADEQSDVDLYMKTDITGAPYFGLVENLRERLCKIIELLNQDHIKASPNMAVEILLDGIKIY